MEAEMGSKLSVTLNSVHSFLGDIDDMSEEQEEAAANVLPAEFFMLLRIIYRR